MNLKQLIKNQIEESMKRAGIPSGHAIVIEIPLHKEHGDYSCNVAMQLAKELKKSPLSIANDIVQHIEKSPEITKIEIANPGFINFYINENTVLIDILTKAIEDKPTPTQQLKIIVEHTAVNPNKAMHVGHLRNAVLGDVLANVYKKLGYKVEVQNYIDDTGLQVADTTNAVLNLNIPQKEGQSFDDYCWDIYTEINKQYETKAELIEKRKEISKLIEEGNNEISKTSADIVNKIVDCHLDLMAKFGIYYDLLVYESGIINFGFWEQAFEQLKTSENFFLETEGKQAGCWVLKYDSEKFGNKIFVRSDGTKVYTAKDTAYQLWKFGLLKKDFRYKQWHRKFNNNLVYKTDENGETSDLYGKGDLVINVIDERQTYPQEMVKHAFKSLGYNKQYENYKHLAYGVVNLSPNTAKTLGLDTSDNKSFYAMSGRKGIGVKVTQLVDLMAINVENMRNSSKTTPEDKKNLVSSTEIAIGALKHYMLKYNPISEVIFDYQEALKLTGNTGPYLQYSYARSCGILNKAGMFVNQIAVIDWQLTPTERELILLLGQWNDLLEAVQLSSNVSQIADYAYKLSAAFHAFYEKNNVLKSEEKVKVFRLSIIKAYNTVIKDVLDVMGIVAPEAM